MLSFSWVVFDCKAKVNQFDLMILSKHDVIWLDIPVNNIFLVAVIQCNSDLLHIFGTRKFINFISLHRISDTATFRKLHSDKEFVLIFVKLEKLRDVRAVL